jgi:RNA polymerase primary sigma factor
LTGIPRSPKLSTANNQNSTNYDFVSSFSSEPLLNAAEEVTLANLINEGKEATRQLDTNTKLNAEERRRLEFTVRKGKRAHDRFVNANTRLVMKIARGYNNRGLDYEDLVSEGIHGLIIAIGKFDVDKGFRFSTYATSWIKQTIGRAITNQANLIRIPEHRANEINKMISSRSKLLTELGREATDAEVAELSDLTEERIKELDGYTAKPVSLHIMVGEGDAELGDLLIDENAVDPADAVTASALNDIVDTTLGFLSDKERQVMRLRFGIGTDNPLTLEATGTQIGVTRERARQIERTAMAKLRHPAHQHLRAYIQ